MFSIFSFLPTVGNQLESFVSVTLCKFGPYTPLHMVSTKNSVAELACRCLELVYGVKERRKGGDKESGDS